MGSVFQRRRKEPLLTRSEMNGIIVILMRIDQTTLNILRLAENGDAEEEAD